MHAYGSPRRSIRGARRGRAVADILAEMLLLAIMVAVAVTLMENVNALVPSSYSAPLGTTLAFGTVTNDSGAYRLTVAYVGSSVELRDLSFQIQVAHAGIWTKAPWAVEVEGLQGNVIATYTSTGGWAPMPAAGVLLVSQDTLVVGAQSSGGLPPGSMLVAIGSQPWSGTVAAILVAVN